jgi:hypothetical protein
MVDFADFLKFYIGDHERPRPYARAKPLAPLSQNKRILLHASLNKTEPAGTARRHGMIELHEAGK